MKAFTKLFFRAFLFMMAALFLSTGAAGLLDVQGALANYFTGVAVSTGAIAAVLPYRRLYVRGLRAATGRKAPGTYDPERTARLEAELGIPPWEEPTPEEPEPDTVSRPDPTVITAKAVLELADRGLPAVSWPEPQYPRWDEELLRKAWHAAHTGREPLILSAGFSFTPASGPSPSAESWTVPPGAFSVPAEAWGSGGGGEYADIALRAIAKQRMPGKCPRTWREAHVAELRALRAETCGQCRELAERAAREQRSFTSTEQRLWDLRVSRLNAIDDLLAEEPLSEPGTTVPELHDAQLAVLTQCADIANQANREGRALTGIERQRLEFLYEKRASLGEQLKEALIRDADAGALPGSWLLPRNARRAPAGS